MLVVYDPALVSYDALLKVFWENHDPTQGMRQGNDVGTQYRSAIYYTTPEQERTARELTKIYGDELARRKYGDITTEIRPASETPYFYAEDHHQQYLSPCQRRREVPGRRLTSFLAAAQHRALDADTRRCDAQPGKHGSRASQA